MADPIYIEKLKSQCDGKKIRFIGEVDHATKVKYLQNAKALLVTGKWGEPFGLHIIEAMACGTPVIAFKDGGIVETVLHGRTGYICDNDWQMMEAIKIIDSIDPRECRKRAKYFSKENMAKNCVKQYLRILKGMEW
jgi:glycosyltransferase involved in cell wall biosynthesis